jgi:hypothetical protein
MLSEGVLPLVFSPVQWYANKQEVLMTTITIALADDRVEKLKQIAARFNISPEDLVRVSIDELLTRPEESFQQAAEYVLNKNSELYRRLA